MPHFLTIEDLDISSKVILLRVDVNVPYDSTTGKISDSERLRAHAKTIKELADKKAKVVILAHQGRRGSSDFIHLDQHANLLSKHVGRTIQFVDDIVDEKAHSAITHLRDGELLLLDNVRFLEDETVEKTALNHAQSKLVKTLGPLGDLFVNDAFSVAHRSHASIVGFTLVMPSLAGRVMERELKACGKALNPKRPNMFILGGAKPEDCVNIMKHLLDKNIVDKVLSCGLVGQLVLMSRGINIGVDNQAFLEKKKSSLLLPQIESIDQKYFDKIEAPIDVAINVNGKRREIAIKDLPTSNLIMDIGVKTVERYSTILQEAQTVVVKGPAGVYEKTDFNIGTQRILKILTKLNTFTLIGGGDTSVAAEHLGFKKSDFSYVSIAGGALITYLSGQPMPGVQALEDAASRINLSNYS